MWLLWAAVTLDVTQSVSSVFFSQSSPDWRCCKGENILKAQEILISSCAEEGYSPVVDVSIIVSWIDVTSDCCDVEHDLRNFATKHVNLSFIAQMQDRDWKDAPHLCRTHWAILSSTCFLDRTSLVTFQCWTSSDTLCVISDGGSASKPHKCLHGCACRNDKQKTVSILKTGKHLHSRKICFILLKQQGSKIIFFHDCQIHNVRRYADKILYIPHSLMTNTKRVTSNSGVQALPQKIFMSNDKVMSTQFCHTEVNLSTQQKARRSRMPASGTGKKSKISAWIIRWTKDQKNLFIK